MIQLNWLWLVVHSWAPVCVFTEQASSSTGLPAPKPISSMYEPSSDELPLGETEKQGPCHNKFSLFVQNGCAAMCCIFILHIFTVVFRNIKCLDETDDHPALIACRANCLALLSLLTGACQQQCFALIACACGCSQKIWNFTMHHDFQSFSILQITNRLVHLTGHRTHWLKVINVVAFCSAVDCGFISALSHLLFSAFLSIPISSSLFSHI